MNRCYLVFLFLITLGGSQVSAEPLPQLEQAQNAIKKGERAKALAAFEDLNKEGFEDADLHYNMGTLLFQEQKLGPAIFHLEQAYRSAPFDSTIHDNLLKVRAARTENTPEAQNIALWKKCLLAFPFHMGLLVWGIVLGLGWLGLMGVLLRKNPQTKVKTLGSVMMIAGMLSTGLMSLRHDLDERRYAALTGNDISGQSAPSENAEPSFMAQEGAYGEVLEAQSDHVRLRLQNGLEAWFHEKHLYFGHGEAP